MTRFTTTCLAFALAALPVPAAAQETHAPPNPPANAAAQRERAAPDSTQGGHAPAENAEAKDFITPHITDSRHLELPWPLPPFHKELALPHWKPIHIGSFELDLSPTKHSVFALLAALACGITLYAAARGHARKTAANGTPGRFSGAVEAVVLYVRSEIILPNVGPHGEKFAPFILTLFFFILFGNFLGLLPWGSTATGNISVTATLAILSFLVIEIAGMRALGWGYIKTIVYWPSDMPLGMKLPMTFIMTPVELLGKFTKPFALALRLFANMTGGHIVILALISLIFAFPIAAPLPIVMSVAIMILELGIALLQAGVFALLTAVFIGQIREAHH